MEQCSQNNSSNDNNKKQKECTLLTLIVIHTKYQTYVETSK